MYTRKELKRAQSTHLFHGVGELLEFGQVDAEDADQEWHRSAAEG
jgi:hypothetical protein